MGWQEWQAVEGFEFTDILYEKKTRDEGGRLARVTVNRPKSLNSFTDHTVEELVVAFDDASHDGLVGVVVLTGAGDRAFSAGGDIKWEGVRSRAQFFMDEPVNRVIRFCRKPVIAAVKGYAIGGGNLATHFGTVTAEPVVDYVSGQVKAPGAYALLPGMTVSMAIARGGGLTESGSMKALKLTRHGVSTGHVDLNAKVEPGDVVNVGESLF